MVEYRVATKEDMELLMGSRLEMLLDRARDRGVTEISLDATEQGRPLYEKMGFTASKECMVLEVGRQR